MNKKLEKAFEIANYMTTLAGQKQIIKEEFYQNVLYYYNGGTFKVTPELISFIGTLISLGKDLEPILVDSNNIPINVGNLIEFQNNILSVYYTAVNEYYTKYEQLRKQRSVESLTNL
jgi:hypothetical protein